MLYSFVMARNFRFDYHFVAVVDVEKVPLFNSAVVFELYEIVEIVEAMVRTVLEAKTCYGSYY